MTDTPAPTPIIDFPELTVTRDQLATAIAAAKTKHDRMPAHWTDRRAAIMNDIHDLIDDWLATEVT